MSTAPRDTRMTIERYVDAARSGDLSRLDEIVAADFHFRDSPPVGVEGIASGLRAMHVGFSDLVITLEQCICDGEWGAFRFVLTGTHSGLFAGRAPTGRRVTWSGADFVRVRDGKLVEMWPVQESLPMLEGIGAIVRVKPES